MIEFAPLKEGELAILLFAASDTPHVFSGKHVKDAGILAPGAIYRHLYALEHRQLLGVVFVGAAPGCPAPYGRQRLYQITKDGAAYAKAWRLAEKTYLELTAIKPATANTNHLVGATANVWTFDYSNKA